VLCHHFSFFSDSFADVVAAIAIGFFFREPFPQSGFFSFRWKPLRSQACSQMCSQLSRK